MVWQAAAIQAGAQVLGGLFGSRSARRTGATLNAIAEAEREQFQQRAGMTAQGIRSAADRWGQGYDFRPVTSRNAFGSAGMDEYGNVTTQLGQVPQQWANQYGGLAGMEYDQLMGLDRNAMAAQRLAQLQELQRPGDQTARTGFMDDLRRRGLMGFTRTDARTGGQANPFATAFESARATRDLQSAYGATDWVEQNIQNRLRNLQGLRGAQANVMSLADSNLQPMQWGYNAFRNANVDRSRFGYGADIGVMEAQLDSMFSPASYWENSRAAAGAAGQARQGMITGLTRGATMLGNAYFQPPQPMQAPAPIEQRTFPQPRSIGYDSGVEVNPIPNPGMITRRPIY